MGRNRYKTWWTSDAQSWSTFYLEDGVCGSNLDLIEEQPILHTSICGTIFTFYALAVYDPQQDIVVIAPVGRIASFCKLWMDPINRVGNFEPVGTHPDVQRRALGRAVMLEGLRYLQAWGMTGAIVRTGVNNVPGIRLYEAVGFHTEAQLLPYARAI